MSSAPVVYLDAQDYSRFGDVLRGKSNTETEALFLELEKKKLAGDAVFAVSMPILTELLQYHPDFRETTMKKAEAVERLCGGWALAYPSRLIAYEIARLAREKLLPEMGTSVSALSSDWHWYPNVTDVFAEMPRQLQEGMQVELAKLPTPRNRQERRARKSQVAKLDTVKAVHQVAPKIAAEYGIPPDAVRGSVAAFLQGKITAEQASRVLFRAICEPKTFVATYFERVESKRDLPKWIRSVGDKLKVELDKLKTLVMPYVGDEEQRNQLKEVLRRRSPHIGSRVVQNGLDGVEEFGISREVAERILSTPELLRQIPSYKVIGAVAEGYTHQVLGLQGDAAKVEHSFAGDLIHSLYLPHVDLWRGDRRFSEVVRRAMPEYGVKIVPTLTGLPDAINTWYQRST